jgi:uncharacterized membrane protein
MATYEAAGGLEWAGRAEMSHGGGNGRRADEKMATALGWFSVGLGLTQLFAPRELARLIGVPERTGLMRACGIRELATGVGILTQERPAGWLWARVAGDLMDVALLARAMRSDEAEPGRVAAAMAAVVGVGAADWIAGQQLSSDGASQDVWEQPDDDVERGAALATSKTRSHHSGGIHVQKSLTVNRSAEDCYTFWRDFTNLPRFMTHVESVQPRGDRSSHWVAKAPLGARVEWDAEIVDDRPGERISWRSLPGSDVQHSGTVRFIPAPGNRGTIVRVQMRYAPPGGMVAALAAKLFGEEPRQQIPQELRRFKAILETGEVPTTEGQPSGKSPLRPSVSPSSPLAERVANLDPSLVNP